MKDRPITIAETALFMRQAADVWSETERIDFVDYMAVNPEAGDIIPDTGGVRKIRWGRQGSGKRGGVRVIYFYYQPDAPLYLLMVYSKAVQTDLTPEGKRAVKALTALLKKQFRN